MRIISGQLKGRNISIPPNFTSRPTTDFAKENLFNVLNNLVDFHSIRVLDLFSGTGSITLEFASRGCECIDSVEIETLHASFIKKNAQAFNLKYVNVIRNDAFKFLNFCNEKYDIIFADPPFNNSKIETIPEMVFKNSLLNHNGLLVLEHSGNYDFSKKPYFLEVRKYGSVNFTFFK